MAKIVKTQVEFEGSIREEEVLVEHDDLNVWTKDEALTLVGSPHPRTDGAARVTGTAEYTYDVNLPRMLWGKILRSPHPHARIKSVDASRARELAGVICVFTHEDCRDVPWYEDSHLLDRTVRYHGEEVAVVAAEDEQTALDALSLIEVDYDVLHHVVDPVKAAEPTAPQVHPQMKPGNNRTAEPAVYRRGDVEVGLKEADIALKRRYRTPSALHHSFETHGSVAMWENDELTIWDSSQNIFGVRSEVAAKLGMALNKVRIISRYMGGGFGSKNSVSKATVLAALMAKRTGRPVKIMLSRQEESLTSGHRPPAIIDIEIGARRDGSLTAIRAYSLCAPGAYGRGGFQVCGPMREMYQCDNVETTQDAVYTNTGPACAFRAPGYVEGAFALESAMDELATELGMDPLDLRLKNYAERNQSRDMDYSQKYLRESYTNGAAKIDWSRRGRPGNGHKLRGLGMASQVWGGGGSPPSYAVMRVNADGTFDLLTGTHDLGTGTKTVMTQIAAEELGVSMDRIRITIGDTLSCPYSLLSAGSLTVPSVGPAVRMAARDVKQQLLDLAASMIDADIESLSVSDGVVRSTEDAGKSVTVDEIAAKAGNYMIIGKGARGPNPEDKSVNTFGAHFVEVEVDTETGQVAVLRVVAAHEFGRVINPLTLSSQIEGGVFQGMGFGVLEDRIIDEASGRFLNPNLTDYHLPTALDVPDVESLYTGPPDTAANNIGAKGAGEPPIIPQAAAIANAVFDATGIRIRELPITPQKVLEAIRAGKRETGGAS